MRKLFALLLLVISLLAVLPITAQESDEPQPVTSADGTFSAVLPAGWTIITEESLILGVTDEVVLEKLDADVVSLEPGEAVVILLGPTVFSEDMELGSQIDLNTAAQYFISELEGLPEFKEPTLSEDGRVLSARSVSNDNVAASFSIMAIGDTAMVGMVAVSAPEDESTMDPVFTEIFGSVALRSQETASPIWRMRGDGTIQLFGAALIEDRLYLLNNTLELIALSIETGEILETISLNGTSLGSIAPASDGNLWGVVYFSSNVIKVSPQGEVLATLEIEPLAEQYASTVVEDSDGNLYLASGTGDQTSAYVLSPEGELLHEFVLTDYSLSFLVDLDIDSQGYLYASEYHDGITVFDQAGSRITSDFGAEYLEEGMSTQVGILPDDTVVFYGLAADGSRHLFHVDSSGRILGEFDPAELGMALVNPVGIVAAADGTIMVVDAPLGDNQYSVYAFRINTD